jgi:hypothetical protein
MGKPRPWSQYTLATPARDDRIPFLDMHASDPIQQNKAATVQALSESICSMGQTLRVDATSGNDSLGKTKAWNSPFKTILAAKNAAVAGDTIIVGPGTYNDKDLLKDHVDYLFLPGAIVRYTGADGWIFNDHQLSITSKILGWGEFDYQGIDTSNSGVLLLTGSAGAVNFQFETLNSLAGTIYQNSETSLDLRGRKVTGASGVQLSPLSTPTDITISEISISGGSQAVVVTNPSLTIPAVLRCDRISGGQGLRINSGLIDIQCREIKSQTVGIDIDSSDSDCIVRINNTRVISSVDAGGNAAIKNSGGLTTLILNGAQLISFGASALFSIINSGGGSFKVYAATVANKTTSGVSFAFGGSRFDIDSTLI